MNRRTTTFAAEAVLVWPLAGLIAAAPAQATTTTFHVDGCSAVHVRSGPSTGYTGLVRARPLT